MIAAGIALIAAVFIVLIAVTVKDMGWKIAAGIWGTSVAITAVIAAGSWLIALGVTQ